jgi:hypothetical protein
MAYEVAPIDSGNTALPGIKMGSEQSCQRVSHPSRLREYPRQRCTPSGGVYPGVGVVLGSSHVWAERADGGIRAEPEALREAQPSKWITGKRIMRRFDEAWPSWLSIHVHSIPRVDPKGRVSGRPMARRP